MRFINYLFLLFAVITGVLTLPCDECSQHRADLKTTQESLNPTCIGGFSNLIMDKQPLHKDLHKAQGHPLIRREIDFNLTYLIHHDWRDNVWEPERHNWNVGVVNDFLSVVKVHYPSEYRGCMVPEKPVWPLRTPSTPAELKIAEVCPNEKLERLYRDAVAELALDKMKTKSQRIHEYSAVKRHAKNFMIASQCQWQWKCKPYYSWYFTWQWWRWGPMEGWKELNYDPQRLIVEKEAARDGLLYLGKKLGEIGLKISKKQEGALPE